MRKINFDRVLCVTCHSCENACAVQHSDADSIDEVVERGYHPLSRIRITARKGKPWMIKCRFCPRPKCVDACPESAITQHEDGYISIDEAQCTGCGLCIEACPFDSIQLDREGKSVKCDLCLDEGVPGCVSVCPVDALSIVESGPKSTESTENTETIQRVQG